MNPFTVPYDFPLALGGHKSKQFSPEDIRGFYLVKSEANGRFAWTDFPGLKPRTTGTGVDRGDHTTSTGVRYVINGTTLYSENASGTRTSIGVIPGSDRAIFADDGSILGIVANHSLYKVVSGVLSAVSQSVITNPESIGFLNNQWILSGANQQFAISNPGDIDTWNALNFATEDSVGDVLYRPYVFNDWAYMLGGKSIVPWYNSGVGNPPFDRQNTTLINIGVAGKYAVCNTNQHMYILADDRKVFQIVGASARPVNTSGASHIIAGYSSVSDCILSSFDIEGQDFVLFTFPTAGENLLYSETGNYWSTLSSGTDKLARARWYGNAVTNCYEKNLVTDYRNGNTYELDLDTATDNGDTRLRIITGNPITGAMIRKPQNQVSVSSFHIPMQTGIGLVTGQGSDPEIMCEWSPEGGQIYDSQAFVSIGVLGDYKKKVTFDKFATGYELVPRIMCSDPVPITFYSGGSVTLHDAGY